MKSFFNKIFNAIASIAILILVVFVLWFFSLPLPPKHQPLEISLEELQTTPGKYIRTYVTLKGANAYHCTFFLSRSFFKAINPSKQIAFTVFSNQYYSDGTPLKGKIFYVQLLNCKGEVGCKIFLKEVKT